MLNIDISAVEKSPVAAKPTYIVEHKGQDWVRINYDTGASTFAIPGYLAENTPLKKIGEFVVASGGTIPNYGKVRFQVEDENGLSRRMQGSVTEVHKPLGAGSEMAQNLDAYIWDTGGVLIPRGGKVAQGLEREFHRLVRQHGNYGEIKLYREGNLYNYYVKKVSKAELAPVSAPVTTDHKEPGPAWQPWKKTSKNLTVGGRASASVATRTQWDALNESSAGAASSGSGFTRPAKP